MSLFRLGLHVAGVSGRLTLQVAMSLVDGKIIAVADSELHLSVKKS